MKKETDIIDIGWVEQENPDLAIRKIGRMHNELHQTDDYES